MLLARYRHFVNSPVQLVQPLVVCYGADYFPLWLVWFSKLCLYIHYYLFWILQSSKCSYCVLSLTSVSFNSAYVLFSIFLFIFHLFMCIVWLSIYLIPYWYSKNESNSRQSINIKTNIFHMVLFCVFCTERQ